MRESDLIFKEILNVLNLKQTVHSLIIKVDSICLV